MFKFHPNFLAKFKHKRFRNFLVTLQIFLSFPFFVTGITMWERGPLWEQFAVTTEAKGGGPGRVRCKSCERLHTPRVHQAQSLQAKIPQQQAPKSLQPATAVVASQAALKQRRRHVHHLQKIRWRNLSAFCDTKISGDQQTAAGKAQCLMVVMAGLSYNSQDHPATLAFFKTLRSDCKGWANTAWGKVSGELLHRGILRPKKCQNRAIPMNFTIKYHLTSCRW